MPRPRKYFTKEDKRIAHNARSQRWYYKRKEEQEQERRRALTRKKQLEKLKKAKEQKDDEGADGVTTSTGLLEESKSIIRKAKQVFSDFCKFVRDAPHLYAEDLYNQYLQPLPDGSRLPPTFFEEKTDTLREWHDFFHHCWDSVYRVEGAVEELQALQNMKVEVSAVISYVEELQCTATMGDTTLKEAYVRKELWFQR